MNTQPYLGAVFVFAGNFAPRGYALCNGQILNIAQNQALFAILGTTYGGNGVTTFGLPDLRGRIAIHQGQGIALGQKGGSETVTVLTSQMPIHNHVPGTVTGSVRGTTTGGTTDFPSAAIPARPSGDLYNTSIDGGGMAVANVTVQSPSSGNGQPLSILSPFLTLNYVIATQGIFPSRN